MTVRRNDLTVLVWIHPPRQHEAGDSIINGLAAALKKSLDVACELTIFPIGTRRVHSRARVTQHLVGLCMGVKVWMAWVRRGSLLAAQALR
jgi:hypothetical protein